MKYYMKILALLYLILSITCFVVSFFSEDGETPIIYGLLLMVLFHIHMLEHTIINTLIRPKKLVINLNGKTFITQGLKEDAVKLLNEIQALEEELK